MGSIGRRVLGAGCLLVLMTVSCTTSSVDSTTASSVADTTTTTVSPREGLIPDPALIRQAHADGAITDLEADLHVTAAAWGAFESIPFEYMVESTPERPQWDHSASSRLIARWAELEVVSQGEILAAVDGLTEFVGRTGLSSLRSGHDGCVPTPIDAVSVCVGASVADDASIDDSVDVVRPWVQEAAVEAWPRFQDLFGGGPDLVRVYLSDLHAEGGYTHGTVEGAGVCHLYVDVVDPDQDDPGLVHIGDDGVPDGTPLEQQAKATTAHQLFHCFQAASGWEFDAALWEGSATWSEHHIYPQANTEVDWMVEFVADPDRVFGSRLFDASFAFLFADQHHGPGVVIDALRRGSVAGLADSEEAFSRLWHEVSLTAWNGDPLLPLINDGSVRVPAEVDDIGLQPVASEAQGTLGFEMPPFSRDIHTVELAGGNAVDELAGFARLRFDLSDVPNDVRITALPRTPAGWSDPVDLFELEEWVVCRSAVGPCNDADPQTIDPYTSIVLLATNVDNGTERFDIGWDSYNPRLDGTWVRTEGPLLTNPGVTAPYAIVGTTLTFDERGMLLQEDTAGYSLVRLEPGWNCTFAGQYSVGADPVYDRPQAGGDVDGVLVVDAAVGGGDAFTNECVFTADSGAENVVTGLHVPVVDDAEDGFGFEIRDYDTLWVYAHERIYVYERE